MSLFLCVVQLTRRNLLLTQLAIILFSFVFYYVSDPAFLPFLIFLSLVNFAFAHAIHKLPEQRTLLLSVILGLDVSFLIGGKLMGHESGNFPLGISFFTFQIMSFILDFYRGNAPLPQNVLHFNSYMFFFPHIVAGPICRANGLMKQMGMSFTKPTPEKIRSGFYLLSFGLLKKAVLADAMAQRIDEIFLSPSRTVGIISWGIVALAYGLQIYFDFSGYTDMARGMAKLIGLDFPLNFSFPYFARTLQDFWRRWHITLSTWFRDFVYIPLGGSDRYVPAILVTFLLSALWHGLGWNFVIWGLWHGIWLVLFKLLLKDRSTLLNQIITLIVVFSGWLFFRSPNLTVIQEIISQIFNFNSLPLIQMLLQFKELLFLIILSSLVEWGACRMRARYRFMNRALVDGIWVIATLCALVFQAPLKEFIYARF